MGYVPRVSDTVYKIILSFILFLVMFAIIYLYYFIIFHNYVYKVKKCVINILIFL